MSTAAAPVSDHSAAFPARAAITCSTPARPPLTTRRRFSATLAICPSFSGRPASQRVSPDSTSVATTISPDFKAGSSPPATPKLTTPLNEAGSSVARSDRNCWGSLLLQITAMPGPAAIRASCTKPRHNKHRPRVNSTARGNVVPRPQSHIPTPTTLLLVLFKFRYRANAQSGKNFA